MYKMTITRMLYPKNESNIYEYSTLDNLLKDLKRMLENHYVASQDIIRIEV